MALLHREREKQHEQKDDDNSGLLSELIIAKNRNGPTTSATAPAPQAGYSYVNSTWAWGPWGNWSAWSKTKVTPTDSRQVETGTVGATYKTQWNYSRWAQYSNNTGVIGPWEGYWNYGKTYCGYFFESGWSDAQKAVSGRQTTASGVTFNLYDGNQWFNETPRQLMVTAAYTQYRYRDRSKQYTYYYKKVDHLMSATEVTAQGNISNVQKWVRYVVG